MQQLATTRATETVDADDDQFAHKFCDCSDVEALCGKRKGVWTMLAPDDPTPMCVVCKEMMRHNGKLQINPCYRCKK